MKTTKVVFLSLVAASLVFLASLRGCEYIPESIFDLAQDSRLPKWVVPPAGLPRADVHVTMTYYNTLLSSKALFTAKASEKIFCKVRAGAQCESFNLTDSAENPLTVYPNYTAVVADGVTEIMEHRQKGSTVYVTDDPAVWRRYNALGCGK